MGLTPFWSGQSMNCTFSHFSVGFTRESGRLPLGCETNLANVGIVQGCVNLIQHKEGSRLIAVEVKTLCQGQSDEG